MSDPNNPNPDQAPEPSDAAPETPPTAGDPTAGDPPTPPAAASSADVQKALDALADIQQRMSQGKPPPSATAPTMEQIRENIKEQTGWTDAQLDFHQNSMVNAVAPLQEQISWMGLEKKFPDLPKYREAMDKELADGYSPAQKANPAILEKVYYLAKGKTMESRPTPPSHQPAPQNPGSTRRMAPAYPGFSGGSDPSGRAPSTTLTEEQKVYARNLGISEERYKAAMATKKVRELKVARA